MSKLRNISISDDGETVYLVDEYQEILAQMSVSWFYIVNPYRTRPPTIEEMKLVLLRYYQDLSGFSLKKFKKVKALPPKVKGRVKSYSREI